MALHLTCMAVCRKGASFVLTPFVSTLVSLLLHLCGLWSVDPQNVVVYSNMHQHHGDTYHISVSIVNSTHHTLVTRAVSHRLYCVNSIVHASLLNYELTHSQGPRHRSGTVQLVLWMCQTHSRKWMLCLSRALSVAGLECRRCTHDTCQSALVHSGDEP